MFYVQRKFTYPVQDMLLSSAATPFSLYLVRELKESILVIYLNMKKQRTVLFDS